MKLLKFFSLRIKELIVFSVLTLFGSQTFADQYTLFGTIGNGITGGSTLYILNQSTGSLEQTVGPIGYLVNGLAYDRTTGNLYATTSANDPSSPNSLILIDIETGAGTVIAPFTLPPGAGSVVTLTCDSSGQLYGWLTFVGSLTRVDKNTGVLSPYPAAATSPNAFSLDFNRNDVLYLLNSGDQNIYTVSTVTGSTTLVGKYYPPATITHHGKFNPNTQQFWAVSETSASSRVLSIFDIPSGALSFSLPTIDFLHTIAFAFNFPPHTLSGTQKRNRFLMETEYFNELHFELIDPVEATAFRVYRNGQLIATLPPTDRTYVDHNQKKNKAVTYTVDVIFADGSISSPQSIVVQ